MLMIIIIIIIIAVIIKMLLVVQTVHKLFEEQVLKKTPDAIAVVFEDEQITYR